MEKLVSSLYDQNDIDLMRVQMTSSIAIASSKGVLLDKKTRQISRKIGTVRQGYTALILPIAINNISVRPRDTDPQLLGDCMTTFNKLAEIRGLAQKMREWCDATYMVLGIDALALTDSW